MSLFYDAEEEKLLQTNLKKICTLHRKIELDTIEPTKEERKFIRNIIDKFIKKRNRIVYGGFAYDLYIKKQSKGEDYIYDDDLHIITISKAKCSHFETILKTLAHEMIHMKRYRTKAWDQHDAEVRRYAKAIADEFCFDPLEL